MPEHAELEREILELHHQLSARTEKIERGDLSQREVLKEIVRERYPLPTASPPTTNPSQGQQNTQGGGSSFLPNYLNDSPADIKLRVEQLIESAWHEGISKALHKAVIAGPFYLNAFHDALADKLYAEFKNRGLIK